MLTTCLTTAGLPAWSPRQFRTHLGAQLHAVFTALRGKTRVGKVFHTPSGLVTQGGTSTNTQVTDLVVTTF